MNDYKELIESLRDNRCICDTLIEDAADAIEQLVKERDTAVKNMETATPAVDAVEVVHGHWIHTGLENVYGGHQHKCSVCDYSLMVSPMCDNENYCCNCGAKMDEVADEET